MKDIEHSDLISTRYLSEIDEALVSALNSCPPFAIGTFIVLRLSGAFVVHHPIAISDSYGTTDALVVHGLIFRFICDSPSQQMTLRSFIYLFTYDTATQMLDFLSNPQRSQHHAMDRRTHNSISERCFSYILNRRLTYFPGIHDWASKSKHRPWLWRWRKPKGAITNTVSEFMWRQKEHIGCHQKLQPFWALVLALKYLPYLLDHATRSEELITLAKMWLYQCPLLVSLFPHDTKKAGKAVEHYLSRFEGKAQCESEVAVGPPPLCIVQKLKCADRNDLLVLAHANCKRICDLSHRETSTVVDIPQGHSYVYNHLPHIFQDTSARISKYLHTTQVRKRKQCNKSG